MDFAQYWYGPSDGEAPTPGFSIENSLRFRGAQHLQRNQADQSNYSADQTWSVWLKLPMSAPIVNSSIFNYQDNWFLFNEPTTLNHVRLDISGGVNTFPDFVCRDVSAWYHFVISNDASANTTRIWCNGELRETISSNFVTGAPSSNMIIGGQTPDGAVRFFEGYMADIYYIDGQALEPTAFGNYNDNGVWVPANYTGTYGTNGFHLDFSDPFDIGADRSGNGNDFTATGFNTTYPGLWSDAVTANKSWNDSLAPYTAGEVNYIWLGGCSSGDCDDATYVFQPTSPIQLNGSTLRLGTGGTSYSQTQFRFTFDDDSVITKDWQENASATTFQDVKTGNVGLVKMEMIYDGPYSTSANHGGWTGLWLGNNKLVDNRGEDYDLMQDSPTQNYATLNPLNSNGSSISSANLQYVGDPGGGNILGAIGSQGASSGKYYWETVIDVQGTPGLVGVTPSSSGGSNVIDLHTLPGTYSYRQDGQKQEGPSGTISAYGDTFTTGDVIGVALDMDHGAVYFSKNGVWQNSGDPTSGAAKTGAAFTSFVGSYTSVNAGASGASGALDFGQQSFLYTPPAGFKALQTQNLPAAPIANGRDHFQVITGPGDVGGVLYAEDAGDATDRDIERPLGTLTDPVSSGSGTYTPSGTSTYSWVWDAGGEASSSAFTVDFHGSTYSVRSSLDGINWNTEADAPSGTNTITSTNPHRYVRIQAPNWGVGAGTQTMTSASGVPILAQAQQAFPNSLIWIKDRANSNQHQLVDSVRGGNLALKCPGFDAETAYVAPAGDSVAWCWKAGGAAVTNNDGTIESQVSANTDAGFSIISYTGTGSNATIGHGLTQPPEFAICRTRTTGNNYAVGGDAIQNWGTALYLNSSQGEEASGGNTFWNNAAPTDSVISLGTALNTNNSGDAMICYAWHSVPGYSAFGSYDGGDTEFPFVWLGFKPAFVLIKSVTFGYDWAIYDSTRSIANPSDLVLASSTTGSELSASSFDIDFLSNGFKLRNSGQPNQLGPYVYCAFAENPFQSPVTAR